MWPIRIRLILCLLGSVTAMAGEVESASKAYPFPSARLRLMEYREIPIYFVGLKPPFAKGQVTRDGRYEVEKYEKKSVITASGVTSDVSELTVRDRKTGRRLVLPKGKVKSFGVFTFEGSEQRVNASVSDTIRLEDGEFEVLKLSRDGAILRERTTHKTVIVPKLGTSP